MNTRMTGTHSTLWQRALLAGSTVTIAALLAACGGPFSKSSPAAPASQQSANGQNVNSLAKFCSDDANEASLENQIGDTPDLSDPATHALLVQDVNDLKTMIAEAPSTLTHDLRTMEGVTATAAAGKDPQGETLYNDYTADVDNLDTWASNNCSSDNDNSSSANGNATGGANPTSTGASSGSGATSQLISTCVSDFESGNWGATSGTDGSGNPTAYCNCVIPASLANDISPQDLASLMQASMSDDGGSYPIQFGSTNCSSSDPTIDPSTGSPWSS